MTEARNDYRDLWFENRDGLHLHARDYPYIGPATGPATGPSTAGASAPGVVLCLHGLTRNAADFETIAPRLARSHRVIALEQRGRGDSDPDPDAGRYEVTRYVQDTLDFIDHLGLGDLALVGTSMGGLMAMMMTAAHPGRFRGVVLDDIGPVVEPSGLARIQGYVGRSTPASSWAEAAANSRAVHGVAFPDYDDEAWLRFARRLYREQADGSLLLAYDPRIAEPMQAAGGDASEAAVPPDLWAVFEAMGDTPVLVVRGALSDILSQATATAMASRKPNVEVVEVPRVGHAPVMDEPEVIEAVTGFLERLG